MKGTSGKRGLGWAAAVLGVAAMLMVSGCSKVYWYSTTKDAQAFAKDRFECEADAANFSTDDPSSDLVYIGNCTSTYEGLEQLIGDIESARVPAGGFYTASIMLGQGTFDSATVAEVEAILEQLAAEVASGRVVYATLPEVVEVWEEGYGAEPSRYPCE